jgi:hypothetical protein
MPAIGLEDVVERHLADLGMARRSLPARIGQAIQQQTPARVYTLENCERGLDRRGRRVGQLDPGVQSPSPARVSSWASVRSLTAASTVVGKLRRIVIIARRSSVVVIAISFLDSAILSRGVRALSRIFSSGKRR